MFFIQRVRRTRAPHAAPARYHAPSRFDGDLTGWLVYVCTDQATASSVAGDFLGEDETALAERQVEEVVCELANMICGSVLSRVESTRHSVWPAPNSHLRTRKYSRNPRRVKPHRSLSEIGNDRRQ